jgi:ribonuclease P protein component
MEDCHVPRENARFRFQRRQRLTRQRDFERVFARKCSAADRHMVVYVDANDLSWTRLGIKPGRQLGNAATRNRIKRVLREAFRLGQHDIPTGLDVICIPRDRSIARANHDSVGKAMQRLIKQAARKQSRRTDPSEETSG